MNLSVDSSTLSRGYDIVICRGAINDISKYISDDRRTMIITDSGVPKAYLNALIGQLSHATSYVFPMGEKSKNAENYISILKALAKNGFTRGDRIIALGGGVVGDLSGFVAATYMRGIQFINIPTTLLSMVDSSIGGKTAIDLDGIKNIVGSFYPPHLVIIDTDTLKTLDDRQFKAGYAEAVKMAACQNKDLFERLEQINGDDIRESIDMIVEGSLKIKRDVVQKDPTEKGLRRVLNFGHTVGHAIESVYKGELLHGECVAIGMLAMCDGEARDRIFALLSSMGLKTSINVSKEELAKYILLDKKNDAGIINTVWVDKIGSFVFKKESVDDILSHTSFTLQKEST